MTRFDQHAKVAMYFLSRYWRIITKNDSGNVLGEREPLDLLWFHFIPMDNVLGRKARMRSHLQTLHSRKWDLFRGKRRGIICRRGVIQKDIMMGYLKPRLCISKEHDVIVDRCIRTGSHDSTHDLRLHDEVAVMAPINCIANLADGRRCCEGLVHPSECDWTCC